MSSSSFLVLPQPKRRKNDNDNDDDGSDNTKTKNTNDEIYTYVHYDKIESTYFSCSSSSHSILPKDTLVWVLKSKGNKNNKNKRISSNNNNERCSSDKFQKNKQKHDATTTTKTTTTTTMSEWSQQQQTQRRRRPSELFLRARVVKDFGCCNSSNHSNGNNHTNNDDDDDERHHHDDHRVLVRYPMGTQYHVRRSNLIPVLERRCDSVSSSVSVIPKHLVVVTRETSDYRRACIVHTCDGNDTFVEIGCDFGTTVRRVQWAMSTIPSPPRTPTTTRPTSTNKERDQRRHNPSNDNNDNTKDDMDTDIPLFTEQSRRNSSGTATVDECREQRVVCIGIDKSSESIAIAKKRFPNCTFALHDALTDNGMKNIRQLCQEQLRVPINRRRNNDDGSVYYGPSVVAVDINGNRELPAVLSCLNNIMNPIPDDGNDNNSNKDTNNDWQLPRLIIVKSRMLYDATFLQNRQSKQATNKQVTVHNLVE